jgi:hypothetical protein
MSPFPQLIHSIEKTPKDFAGVHFLFSTAHNQDFILQKCPPAGGASE